MSTTASGVPSSQLSDSAKEELRVNSDVLRELIVHLRRLNKEGSELRCRALSTAITQAETSYLWLQQVDAKEGF